MAQRFESHDVYENEALSLNGRRPRGIWPGFQTGNREWPICGRQVGTMSGPKAVWRRQS